MKIGNLEKSFEDGLFRNEQIKMVIKIMMITNEWLGKYGNRNIRNWKLSSEIGQLKSHIAKFRNRNFEELDFNDWGF